MWGIWVLEIRNRKYRFWVDTMCWGTWTLRGWRPRDLASTMAGQTLRCRSDTPEPLDVMPISSHSHGSSSGSCSTIMESDPKTLQQMVFQVYSSTQYFGLVVFRRPGRQCPGPACPSLEQWPHSRNIAASLGPKCKPHIHMDALS